MLLSLFIGVIILKKHSFLKKLRNTIDILRVIDYNFASLISITACLMCRSGCSSVWLEYLVWDQGAEGSSPFTPTIFFEITTFIFKNQFTWWD